jgi:hypothetical protein
MYSVIPKQNKFDTLLHLVGFTIEMYGRANVNVKKGIFTINILQQMAAGLLHFLYETWDLVRKYDDRIMEVTIIKRLHTLITYKVHSFR